MDDNGISSRKARCVYCGTSSKWIGAVDHVRPKFPIQEFDADNLVFICSNCNKEYALKEIEFIDYLVQLMRASGEYTEIKLEELISPSCRPDITAVSAAGESLLIECKRDSAFTQPRFSGAVSQVLNYRRVSNFDKYILAFPGVLSEEQSKKLSSQGIEAWSAPVLATKFRREIGKVDHPILQMILGQSALDSSSSQEVGFIAELKACVSGTKGWSSYQKLIGRILEDLFCPPLEAPISELSDFDKVNRRDLILPNYADDGFWRFVREKYHADYIVVDAKNYTGKIKKDQVLQMANYLKVHGAGMFALIVTRLGANKSAELVVREQWMANRKMILVLTDEDLEAMLLAKAAGGDPTKIIGEALQRFRLSM